MKKICSLILIAIAVVTNNANAQQLPLFSQYMHNDFVINPAITGSKDFTPIQTTYRTQWVGLEGHPVTQTLSGHTPLRKQNMGLGGFLYNDKVGPLSKTGLNISYAYHLKVGEKNKLSFGLAGLLYIYKVRTDRMQFDSDQNSDDVLNSGNFSAFYPNFTFGTYFSNPKYFAGFSIPDLIQTKVSYSQDYYVLKEKRHYFINGGYNWEINKDYTLVPSTLIKYVGGAPIQVDLNAVLKANKKFDLGISYRSGDALVILAGYHFEEKLHIGYSYDVTLTNLNKYSSGSHEIWIGIDLFTANTDGNRSRF